MNKETEKEIKRIKELIELNDILLKPFFEDDKQYN